jgi:hypothetical protein
VFLHVTIHAERGVCQWHRPDKTVSVPVPPNAEDTTIHMTFQMFCRTLITTGEYKKARVIVD